VVIGFAGAVWLGCGDDSATPSGGGDGGADGTAGDSGADAGTDGGGDTSPATVSCATYCDLVTQHCTGDIPPSGGADAATKQYNTKEACLLECSKMPVGAVTDTSGNTVGCRQYHAGALAEQLPVVHCPHAGPTGGGTCGTDRCAAFCSLMAAVCLGDAGTGVAAGDVPFPDVTACLAACGNGPYAFDKTQGELTQGASSGTDDLNCRDYHLMAAYTAFAASNPSLGSTHCSHLKVASATCK